MTKSVSATEAKNRLGALVKTVIEEGETVLIENRREPVVVLLPLSDYQELQALRKEKRIREAQATLRRIEERQAELNKDLTEEQAEELVQRYIAEVREERRQQALAASR